MRWSAWSAIALLQCALIVNVLQATIAPPEAKRHFSLSSESPLSGRVAAAEFPPGAEFDETPWTRTTAPYAVRESSDASLWKTGVATLKSWAVTLKKASANRPVLRRLRAVERATRFAYPSHVPWPACESTPSSCLAKAAEFAVHKAIGPWRKGLTSYQHLPNYDFGVSQLWRDDDGGRYSFNTECSGFLSWLIKYGIGRVGTTLFGEISKRAYRINPKDFKGNDPMRPQASAYYKAFKLASAATRSWQLIRKTSVIRRGDILAYKIKREEKTDSGHVFVILSIRREKWTFTQPGYTRYETLVADSTSRHHYKNDTRWQGGCIGWKWPRHKYNKSKRVGRNNEASCGEKSFKAGKCASGCGVGVGYVYLFAKKQLSTVNGRSDLHAVALFPDRVHTGPPMSMKDFANSKDHLYAVGRLSSRAYINGREPRPRPIARERPRPRPRQRPRPRPRLRPRVRRPRPRPPGRERPRHRPSPPPT